MNSNDDNERRNSGDGDTVPSGVVVSPLPPPARASATTKKEDGEFDPSRNDPDRPFDPTPIPAQQLPATSRPSLRLSEGTRLPKSVQSLTSLPMDEDSDEAPVPPEFIAASFEDDASKPALIDDDSRAAQDPRKRWVDVPSEGHVHDEDSIQGEDEDDEAPIPPGMIAASFEEHGNEEEKREECEGPRKLPAASREAMIHDAHHEAEMNPEVLEECITYGITYGLGDTNTAHVPEERVASANESEANTCSIQADIGRLHEVINEETPMTVENQELPPNSSFPPDQPHRTTSTNAQDQTLAVRVPNRANEDLMSPPTRLYFDLNNQSLPLLEATLVKDDETVYDAIRISNTEHNDEPGCLRKNHRLVIFGLAMVAIAAIITVGVVIADRDPAGISTVPSSSPTEGDSTTIPEIIQQNSVSEVMNSSVPK
jgi:hypothetical protein